jgi:hypothetical protein
MRICLFCDNVANSKEDAWPDWLIRCVGEDPKSPTRYWRSTLSPPQEWPGPRVPVKNVCKTCNGGWMSDLENAARRPMGCLLHDLSVSLSPNDQQILATWCCKTAMVFESVKQDKNKFYSPTERQNLRAIHTLPTDTFVWLGRCAQSYLLHAESRKLRVKKPTKNSSVIDGCATTFVAKRLILQMLSIRRAPDSDVVNLKLEIQGGNWQRSLIQAWPRAERAVIWPPPQAFGEHDDSLEKLMQRFSVGVRFGN